MTQEFTPYETVIADLEQKRDQLTATIEMLKAIRGTVTTILPESRGAAPQAVDTEIKRDSFFGMKLPDAARKYLSMAKTTKSNPDLCNALLSGGFKTSSANFTEVVRSTLQRNKDFVKVNGEWGLAEWYPGRGGGRRIRRLTPEGAAPEAVVESVKPEDAEDSEDNGE